MTETVVHVLLVAGSLIMLLAAVGLLRLPDVYMRLQAASKAVTMGVGLMMLAVAVHFHTPGGMLRALAVFVFTSFTAPVAAHLLANVAYRLGCPLWEDTKVDELRSAITAPGPTVGRSSIRQASLQHNNDTSACSLDDQQHRAVKSDAD